MRCRPRWDENGKRTKEYRTWASMRGRCNSPQHRAYKSYGGRGIKVCARWNDFENFAEDMGVAPSQELQLDRINNDKGYEPGNVRWATRHQQTRNRSANVFITINNCRLCLKDWANWLGINDTAIKHRKFKMGWSWPDAILTPFEGVGKRVKRMSERGITWDEGTDFL